MKRAVVNEEDNELTSQSSRQPRCLRDHRSVSNGAAALAPLAALPQPLIRELLFPFLAAPALLSATHFDIHDYEGELAPLRAVCRQWKAIADSLKKESWRMVCTPFLNHRHRGRDLTNWLDYAAETGATASCLAIHTDHGAKRASQQRELSTPAEDGEMALDRSFWKSYFSHFQNVVRLDLTSASFQLLADIMRAAAMACPNVQALVLPLQPALEDVDDVQFGVEESAGVVAALGKWHTLHGGLRLLHVPFWPTHLHRDLLDAIIKYCPGIRYLRGRHYSESHVRDDNITALGTSDELLWAKFCRVCTELREFDWRLAQLWGLYVAPFRETVKPFLRKMIIKDQRGRTNVDYALTMVESILPATPKLRELELVLMDRMFFLIAENHPAYENMTGSLTDAFIVDVVAKCPQLQQLHFTMKSPDRELTVTTHSLAALVAMPNIRDIKLTRVVFDTVALVPLLRSLRQRVDGDCNHCHALKLHLKAADAAHDSILALLQDLAANPSEYMNLRLEFRISREDMVRKTYPRGILVRYLLSEEGLSQLVTTLNGAFAHSRVSVWLRTHAFGMTKKRHAISEMSLDVSDMPTIRPSCEVVSDQVAHYKRRAGRVA